MPTFNLPPGCTLDDIDPPEDAEARRQRIEDERADRDDDEINETENTQNTP